MLKPALPSWTWSLRWLQLYFYKGASIMHSRWCVFMQIKKKIWLKKCLPTKWELLLFSTHRLNSLYCAVWRGQAVPCLLIMPGNTEIRLLFSHFFPLTSTKCMYFLCFRKWSLELAVDREVLEYGPDKTNAASLPTRFKKKKPCTSVL